MKPRGRVPKGESQGVKCKQRYKNCGLQENRIWEARLLAAEGNNSPTVARVLSNEPRDRSFLLQRGRRVHKSLPEWDVTGMSQVVNSAFASKYAAYRHRVAARCNGNANDQQPSNLTFLNNRQLPFISTLTNSYLNSEYGSLFV